MVLISDSLYTCGTRIQQRGQYGFNIGGAFNIA